MTRARVVEFSTGRIQYPIDDRDEQTLRVHFQKQVVDSFKRYRGADAALNQARKSAWLCAMKIAAGMPLSETSPTIKAM